MVATEDEGGLKRLVGYIVLQSDNTTDSLGTYLRTVLPEYMVPQLWVCIDKLPLTANGKVDYRALVRERTDNGAHG